MMIICRTLLSVIVLRLSLSLYLTNPGGRPFLRHKGAAEVKPPVPDLGLVVEPMSLLPVRPEEVDDGLAASRQELRDQPAVTAPPDRFGAHEAGRRFAES